MIKQPGCTSGKHKFVRDGPVKGELVKCRVQSYQGGGEVCVDVFAKNVNQEESKVVIDGKNVSLDLTMNDGTRFEKSWTNIPWAVDLDRSRYTYRSTKVEIVLGKASADTWDLEFFK